MGRSVIARRRAGSVIARAALVEDEVEQPAHYANNDGAPEGRPEAGDMERKPELARYPAAQPEQQSVDDQADQPERKNVEQAADGLDDGLEYRIDDAEDQGDDDERPRLLPAAAAVELDAGYQQVSDVEGSRGYQDSQHGLHAAIRP